MHTFPKPLTPGEERSCLERMKEGDHEARNTLIERNLRLVAHVTRKYQGTDYEMEDLLSIGTIGLIKAVNTFHPERGSRLATYAAKCIENEILMVLRKTNRLKLEVSFDEPLNTDWDGNELLLSDILGTEADIVLQPIEADADCQMLLSALETLTQREREIITLRYGLGGHREQTQKEVADRLGISQSYISRLEKRTLLRLRRELQRLS